MPEYVYIGQYCKIIYICTHRPEDLNSVSKTNQECFALLPTNVNFFFPPPAPGNGYK